MPKPHTPFQWSTQLEPGELRSILGHLREELRRRGATLKWHHPEISALEGAFARGDRRLARVIHRAWRKGRRFDGWTEQFAFPAWQEAFAEEGIDLEAAIGRAWEPEAPLPWEPWPSPPPGIAGGPPPPPSRSGSFRARLKSPAPPRR